MKPSLRLVLATLAFAGFTQAAHAGLFDDDEARKRIDATAARVDKLQRDLDTRIADLEQQFKSQGLNLLNELEAIKGDIAKIRGQIEVLTYELNEAQKRQKDLYVDLDTRMRKLEGGPSGGAPADNAVAGTPSADAAAPASGTPPVAPAAPALPASATEQRAYDAALDQFKRGDYVGAIAGFQSYVKTYPRSPLAASAQYWVGNAQFARKDYRAAIASQRLLIQQWPDSAKVPDALLNIASAQAETGDTAAARRTLEELIAKYPQSDSAAKAKQRLGVR
jgi:tol-pal system protein YbgF